MHASIIFRQKLWKRFFQRCSTTIFGTLTWRPSCRGSCTVIKLSNSVPGVWCGILRPTHRMQGYGCVLAYPNSTSCSVACLLGTFLGQKLPLSIWDEGAGMLSYCVCVHFVGCPWSTSCLTLYCSNIFQDTNNIVLYFYSSTSSPHALTNTHTQRGEVCDTWDYTICSVISSQYYCISKLSCSNSFSLSLSLPLLISVYLSPRKSTLHNGEVYKNWSLLADYLIPVPPAYPSPLLL